MMLCWVIVNKLTKPAHFLPIQSDSLDELAKLYTFRIVRLHGVQILLCWIEIFILLHIFWESLQKVMGIMLHFSTAFILKQMDNPREQFKH